MLLTRCYWSWMVRQVKMRLNRRASSLRQLMLPHLLSQSLDGTAKGGVVLGISDQFKIPVKYIGVGEKMEDLLIFNKQAFVDSLFS